MAAEMNAAEGREEQTAEVRGEEGAKRPAHRRRRRPSTKTKEAVQNVEATTEDAAPAASETVKEEKPAAKRSSGRRRTPRKAEAPLSVVAAASEAAAERTEIAGSTRTHRGSRRKKSDGTQMKKNGSIKIIPLGGLDQIGMNITAFESDDSIIIVDCGLAFPSNDMLGIDLVIPDISYLKSHMSKIKGFVITHGHEDHIGALPYVLQQINVPVYGTRLTLALIEGKLRERGLDRMVKLNVQAFGDTVDFGDIKVEFIKTNHSIQDAAALAIFTPAGTIVHTGDFKVDYTPVFGDPIDLQRFAELGKEGVLAMMSDSTNATKPGSTMSERTVGGTFERIFAEHQQNRIIVATFASNVDRVQQIINTAAKYKRKVVVEGRSMVNVITVASELHYIDIPEGTLISIDELRNYPDEQTVLITTGSQGESMAALSRMASGMHRKVRIKPNDVVVLSSHPIPGNELAVDKVINELSMLHAQVILQDTHVSGHACAEDLKLLYSLVKPTYAIPVHGEYHMRATASRLATSVGVNKDNCLMLENGDVLELTVRNGEPKAQVKDHVQAGGVFVDGLGVGDVGNIVIRDRQNLAQNGIIVVVLTLEKYSGHLLAGPDLVSRGFVYVRESEDLMEEARVQVQDAVDDCLVRHVNDWGKIKNIIKDSLADFLWKKIKRDPVILPIIMEV
ncbi:MAG TPA: RNase J family beta-CASP ribonuclease [Oribacterium sp.]|nr:RNase J family beta-CASP ribonuclease [Oribacterium sp.]HCS68019.1 RNase J family beta-CASP ribonuclease [Oribacterium sp.]